MRLRNRFAYFFLKFHLEHFANLQARVLSTILFFLCVQVPLFTHRLCTTHYVSKLSRCFSVIRQNFWTLNISDYKKFWTFNLKNCPKILMFKILGFNVLEGLHARLEGLSCLADFSAVHFKFQLRFQSQKFHATTRGAILESRTCVCTDPN